MRTVLIGARPWRAIATAVALLTGISVAGCDLGATTSPTPSAVSAASTAPGPPSDAPPEGSCTADALAVSGGSWSSAAGSRGAEILVQNQGDAACSLPSTMLVAIVDASSAPLAETEPAAGPDLMLQPGSSATFMLLFGNWCGEAPALPLHVVLRAADAGVQVQGLDLAEADLPPCNAPGDPPLLTAQPWSEG